MTRPFSLSHSAVTSRVTTSPISWPSVAASTLVVTLPIPTKRFPLPGRSIGPSWAADDSTLDIGQGSVLCSRVSGGGGRPDTPGAVVSDTVAAQPVPRPPTASAAAARLAARRARSPGASGRPAPTASARDPGSTAASMRASTAGSTVTDRLGTARRNTGTRGTSDPGGRAGP